MFSDVVNRQASEKSWLAWVWFLLIAPTFMACSMHFFEDSRQIAFVCLITWCVLSSLRPKRIPEFQRTWTSAVGVANAQPILDEDLPLSWKMFRYVLVLSLLSLFVWPLWPVAGAACLVWLLAFFASDLYQGSRISRSPLTILSLR